MSFTPVGENLQDHLKLEIGPFHVNPSETWNLQDNLTDLDLKTYDQNHDGSKFLLLIHTSFCLLDFTHNHSVVQARCRHPSRLVKPLHTSRHQGQS